MVRLRSKTCPSASPAVGGGRRRSEAGRHGSVGSRAGDGRCRRSPAANSSAGECGVKDQVSRTQLHMHRDDRPGRTGDRRVARPTAEGGAAVDVVIVDARTTCPTRCGRWPGEGGQARPACPGPRAGRGPLLRGPQSADRRPRGVRGDHRPATATPSGPGPPPRRRRWPWTWWWRSSSTRSSGSRAAAWPGPTPGAAGQPLSTCRSRCARPEGSATPSPGPAVEAASSSTRCPGAAERARPDGRVRGLMSVFTKVLRAGEGKKVRRLAELVPLRQRARARDRGPVRRRAARHAPASSASAWTTARRLDDLLVEAFATGARGGLAGARPAPLRRPADGRAWPCTSAGSPR